MKYIGTFNDINNNEYQVKIEIANGSNTTQNLVMSGEPFVTEMDESDETIYKPVKYQSATIGLLVEGENYLFDLYSGQAQHAKVTLSRVSNGSSYSTRWLGYITPSLYDQGYEAQVEELQVDCIDGLSTLQYFKYEPISTDREIVTFKDLLVHIIQKCGCYSQLYLANNTVDGNNNALWNKLIISESNFYPQEDEYDENGDRLTDDDATYQDVLEMVMQYMGCVCFAVYNNVYVVDLDAIKAGNYNCTSVNLSNGTTGTTVFPHVFINGNTVTPYYTVTSDSYQENGQTISLDKVYNKVSVRDNFNTFETVIPSIYENENLVNITSSTDAVLASSTSINNGLYGEVVTSPIYLDQAQTNSNMIVFLDQTYDEQHSTYKETNAVFVRYFNNPNYKFYKYQWNGSQLVDVTNSLSTINYTDTRSLYGATIAKIDVEDLDKDYTWFDRIIDDILNTQTLDRYLANNDISTVKFDDYILMFNPEAHHINNSNITSYPYFETNLSNSNILFGGENAYLVITGSYGYHSFGNDMYPIPDSQCDISEGRYEINKDTAYLLAKLELGGKYWNGTSWVSNATTFQIPILKENQREDATMFKANEIVNTVSWRIGTDEKGYLISLPDSTIVSGVPKLTMYKPMDFITASHGNHYPAYFSFLKDFDIKAITADPSYSGLNDTDTVYTNVIDALNVEELDDIEFDITTSDGKNPALSNVGYTDGVNYSYLDTTYNIATDQTLRQEQHLIYRLVTQYSEPAIIIEASFDTFVPAYNLVYFPNLDKYFIVDKVDVDYLNNNYTYKLIEKK